MVPNKLELMNAVYVSCGVIGGLKSSAENVMTCGARTLKLNVDVAE